MHNSVFLAAGLAACGVWLGGCNAAQPENLSLGATLQQARGDLRRMRDTPVRLSRPVVVVAGWHSPRWFATDLADALRKATDQTPDHFLPVSYTWDASFDRPTDALVRAVEARWPSDDPAVTTEVDVVAFSAGGLTARWAALPPQDRVRDGEPGPRGESPTGKRLRIARLFTIGTPHLGAVMADRVAVDAMTIDMQPDSGFLKTLNRGHWPAGYEVVCYAMVGDAWAGARHAAPPGVTPIWTRGEWFGSHIAALRNDVFIADVARRLRGEMPLVEPGEPPPVD